MKIGDYDVIFENKRRYYVEDLSDRDYFLENTTPYLLNVDEYEIKESAWGEMIRNLAAYLIEQNPSYKKDIYEYRTPWSKSPMFSMDERTNFKQIDKKIYINCNHTALHSCWFIQDLLDYFKVDLKRVKLLIHRPCAAEPEAVKEYVLEKVKREFSVYLSTVESLDDEEINIVISNIENVINLELKEFSKSYDNFFLFDDLNTLYNYVDKCIKRINKSKDYDEDNKEILIYCLNCLLNFYRV